MADGVRTPELKPMAGGPGRRGWVGPMLMVASAATWAAGLILTKITLAATGAVPSAVLVVQLSTSVGVLLVACLVTGTSIREGWRNGWVGLLEPGIAYQFALAGLALTSAAHASVLGSLEPVLVPLIAWVLLRHRPQVRTFAAIAGATMGSVLVSFSGGDGSGGGSLVGDGLIVASVAVAALYVVLASRHAASVPPLPAALTQQAWALALVVGYGAALSGGAFWPHLTLHGLLLAGASGVLNYALPFWLYLSALRHLPVARAAMYLTLIPVFGVLGSVLLLREQLTWLDLAGGVLIVGALLYDATASARADRVAANAVRAAEVEVAAR
jgi:drug/metabolite transporter (DMT)-like permease